MEEKFYLFLIYSIFFLSTAFLSFLINGLFLKFSTSLGIRNPSETIIRWSPDAKPAFGGISFFIIFLMSISSYPIFFEQHRFLFNKQLLGLLGASTLAFLLGLSDDAYNTKPVLKLIIQIGCAIILIGTGTYMSVFQNIYLNYAFTVLWIVGLMNSINMLDNMDAIATLVGITIVMNILLSLYLNHHADEIYILLLIGVMSALIGFLFFNWHPSKIFMGDTGSQFLGLFLGAMSIRCFWLQPQTLVAPSPITKNLFITILTFAIPIIDTATVVINRILKGKSPFIGGKDHTTHTLFYMGITEKRIAILYVGICLLSVFLNYIIIGRIQNWTYLHIILFSIYFLLLFWFLYAPTRKHR